MDVHSGVPRSIAARHYRPWSAAPITPESYTQMLELAPQILKTPVSAASLTRQLPATFPERLRGEGKAGVSERPRRKGESGLRAALALKLELRPDGNSSHMVDLAAWDLVSSVANLLTRKKICSLVGF
jgi:hypothetical protein